MAVCETAEIIEKREIAKDHYTLTFSSKKISSLSQPGQFLNVAIPDLFLPRPLSVHSREERNITILFRVVGKGTEKLSHLNKGDKLSIHGPLGKGFDFSHRLKNAILVAGGIGVAPLLFLAQKLKEKKVNLQICIGALTKYELFCIDDFQKYGEVILSTDDGSCGEKCLATDSLSLLLQKMNPSDTAIFSCGPKAMLKTVAQIAAQNKIPCQVSIEEHMACGTGACLGCVCQTKSGEYKTVCKDGPVFAAEEIF